MSKRKEQKQQAAEDETHHEAAREEAVAHLEQIVRTWHPESSEREDTMRRVFGPSS